MRLACIVVPAAAIQAVVRRAPHLAGQAVALVDSEHPPRIVGMSRAAKAAGVALGQSVATARASCADLRVQVIDHVAARELIAGLADALGELSPRTQLDLDRGAVLAQLPAGARGTSFAERVLEVAQRMGVVVRVGVADDVFTSWVATQAQPRASIRCVPTGGGAAFLSSQSIDVLPIDPEVGHTLALLGVRRLGEFAALPPPSVGRRWSAGTLDLQALARGDGPRALAGSPRGRIHEVLTITPATREADALAFMLLPLAERVCARTVGRGRTAGTLRVVLQHEVHEPGQKVIETVLEVSVAAGSVHARTWVDLVRTKLGRAPLAHPVSQVELEVIGECARQAEAMDLFARAAAISRSTQAAAAMRPAAARRREPRITATTDLFARQHNVATALRVMPLPTPEPGSLQVVEPPAPLATQGDRTDGAPEVVVLGDVAHRVVATLGPTRLDAPWANDSVSRDYWELTLADGRRLWTFRDRVRGGLYLAGIMR